jgi:hypothetical protein
MFIQSYSQEFTLFLISIIKKCKFDVYLFAIILIWAKGAAYACFAISYVEAY